MQKFLSGLILLAFTAGLGCQEDNDRLPVYPAHGKVTVNGQPAEGARVVFYPSVTEVDGLPMPTPAANTEVGGIYHLESYESRDGAPVGEYSVSVVWLEPPPPNAEQLGVYEQKDRLKNRYSDPKKSGLSATVEAGGGELPSFDLK